eukprot:8587176-Pyramimonas_sp.AAC.1
MCIRDRYCPCRALVSSAPKVVASEPLDPLSGRVARAAILAGRVRLGGWPQRTHSIGWVAAG